VRAVREALPHAGETGHVYVALPPLYRIDLGKEVYYALTEEEKPACWSS
jgi:topoisomerase-4 subunit B